MNPCSYCRAGPYCHTTPTDDPGISDLICQLKFFLSFSLSETHNTHSGVQTETQLIEIHMPSQLKEKKNRKLSCDNNKNTIFNVGSVLVCLRQRLFEQHRKPA